ncbi:hypothetical protein [Burkholderia cenocepacia]|uniref:hypothetical protein n=1 Tax=Burkholderia cenocepacia TaxID=95486 RepID=UPI00097CA21C|nr:hypothetical protein [Burkholderia cenocepacia]AQQ23315.1 hypothetical protein A8D61_32795 [Burkholderia cenocepacia]AQQ45981.1 hypothetical protein A8F32_08895 [Burkholderia cenocepacia]MBR8262951.1 hypothetical protein [Burkholderia cenocepacia]MCW3537473.1 hypothetical protein [Burkholderia cenocepacia]MDN7539597.1 hypothetical protein [Burkholderia cenocepacia]
MAGAAARFPAAGVRPALSGEVQDSTPDHLLDGFLAHAERTTRYPDNRRADAAHPTGRAVVFAHGRRYVQLMNGAYDWA